MDPSLEGGLSLKRFFRGISIYLLIIILVMFAYRMLGQEEETIKEIDTTELIEHIADNNVKSVREQGNVIEGELKDGKKFSTFLPSSVRNTFYDNYLKDKVDSKDIRYIG